MKTYKTKWTLIYDMIFDFRLNILESIIRVDIYP